ncbi:MAG: hypothetical protein JKY92_06525 [Magnetovibrio sp.]|nr:hypothetical protein [Magnetovibrio sp.]
MITFDTIRFDTFENLLMGVGVAAVVSLTIIFFKTLSNMKQPELRPIPLRPTPVRVRRENMRTRRQIR